MDENQILTLMQRVGRSLTTGDVRDVSACWEVPGMLLSDEGAVTVADEEQMQRFFAQTIDWYRSRGLVSTRPELEHVDMLSERLAAVDVRWPSFDAFGRQQASERSHYILQQGKDDRVRIRVALARNPTDGAG